MKLSRVKEYFIFRILILKFCAAIPLSFYGQSTTVSGRIYEVSTGDKIPFANVFFKNSTLGTISDTNGFYTITTQKRYDSISISVLGYSKITLPVKPGVNQIIDFPLKSTMFDLSEVVINPGENPAWEILRRVIANKEINRPDAKESYQYEEYSKIQFDLNHFTEKIQNNIILRPFDFIWESVDSTEDGVAYLPILLIEEISDHYHVKDGNKNREVIKAYKSTGLKGPKIMEFARDMNLHPNFYDNYATLIEKNFPSPINDNYKANYKFYLTDSLVTDGEIYYKIVFKTKAFNAQAFEGNMLIHKGTYALKEITVRFDISANINFVRSYWVKEEFKMDENKNWMLSESRILADFTVLENQSEMTGFFGRKTASIKNLKVNEPIPDSIFKGVGERVFQENSDSRNEEFWDKERHTNLTVEEENIYTMTKKVEEHPAFKLRRNIIYAITKSYYPKRYIDLGDIFTFYSYNTIEYSRLKVGFRTNKDLFANTSISAFTAYGFRDDQFKYGGNIEHTFIEKRNKFVKIGALYKYDIEQLGWSYNFLPIDHVISSLILVNVAKTRTYNERAEIFLERQWFTGFNTRLTAFSHIVSPTAGLNFNVTDGIDTTRVQSFNRAGGKISLRYAHNDRHTNAEYYSSTHFRDADSWPIISAEYSFGMKNLVQSQFEYQELKIRLEKQHKIKKWGYTNYRVEVGKIWGTLPYHFLEIPQANELIVMDRISFNLMNYLEFINDEFAQLQVTHHFDGIFMSVVPLLKKAKVRTLIFGKVLGGRISAANNQETYLFSAGSYTMTTPYYEAGFGLENILKIARVDFIWRLNYLDHPNVYPFIIKPVFQLRF